MGGPKGPDVLTAKRALELINRHIEELAEAEHEGWMHEKQRNGWSNGARKDEMRIHPLLVPYCKLPEAEKVKDRANVRNYPAIVADAGFGLTDKAPT